MKYQKKKGGGANWMDTYGDMVTLLLCFFVMLYSISSIDENKWMALVRSFNPNAVLTETENSGDEGPSSDPTSGVGMEQYDNLNLQEREELQKKIDQSIEELYRALKEYAKKSGKSIEVSKGDGYVFVSFNEAVFFDGDSYVLRPDGRDVLITVSDILSKAAPYIDEVRIMGHTAQASATTPNDVNFDRFLASNRATVATVFIQEHSSLDPARLVSEGFGQHRPADTNLTPEGRSHNRRVEFIVTGLNVLDQLGDSIEKYYSFTKGSHTEQ